MTKAIHVLIMLIFSFFSYADELSSKTQFMIEHPMINFSSLVSLGFQGKVAEVNISGYKLESIGDQKFQFILPKEKLIFSPIGLLEYSSNYSGVELRRSWKFDNEKLLDINEERLNFEGDRESLLTLHYLYDDKGNLSKIESERIFGESLKSDLGCFKFLFSSNVVHARDCALSNRLTHTFNDKYKVESIENSTISNKGSSKKRITIFEYDGEKLKNSKSYLDNELVGSSIYTYHENGAKKTNITKFLSNNIATSITTCTYDNYENETSCIYEKEKPKGHNPIFGDFIAKTETRTMHIQKNDEYGNPLSIESNFYEVFDDKTETLLKREFRTYKYEYYKG
jgi:hypothetical protein